MHFYNITERIFKPEKSYLLLKYIVVLVPTATGSCFYHADSTNNKHGKQGDEFHSGGGGVCQPYLNAVVVVR